MIPTTTRLFQAPRVIQLRHKTLRISTLPNEWARVPHNIRSNNPALLAYTYGLVTALPPNNYSCTTMNIIDHLYIGVLYPPLNTAILGNLATFTQHQLTQHYNRFSSPFSAKPPTIMNIYHDKATPEPLFNHALLAIDLLQDDKFRKLYIQAWTNVTLALFQRPKNVQLIIDALIYKHASHYLSTRTIIPRDKPIKPVSHQKLFRWKTIMNNPPSRPLVQYHPLLTKSKGASPTSPHNTLTSYPLSNQSPTLATHPIIYFHISLPPSIYQLAQTHCH